MRFQRRSLGFSSLELRNAPASATSARTMKFRSPKESLGSFSEINVHSSVFDALSAMEISKPTVIQTEVIPVALSGADLIAVAQTGSGKTLAFVLPVLSLLQKNPAVRALIMAPSREMAQQIY